jgi:hypothetical protein
MNAPFCEEATLLRLASVLIPVATIIEGKPKQKPHQTNLGDRPKTIIPQNHGTHVKRNVAAMPFLSSHKPAIDPPSSNTLAELEEINHQEEPSQQQDQHHPHQQQQEPNEKQRGIHPPGNRVPTKKDDTMMRISVKDQFRAVPLLLSVPPDDATRAKAAGLPGPNFKDQMRVAGAGGPQQRQQRGAPTMMTSNQPSNSNHSGPAVTNLLLSAELVDQDQLDLDAESRLRRLLANVVTGEAQVVPDESSSRA